MREITGVGPIVVDGDSVANVFDLSIAKGSMIAFEIRHLKKKTGCIFIKTEPNLPDETIPKVQRASPHPFA